MAFVRLTYHRRLFAGLLLYSWMMVGCFACFQYHREKQFKAETLDARLQTINEHLLAELARTGVPDPEMLTDVHGLPGLRVSVIDASGRVVFDNSLDSLPAGNHLSREEIARAVADGHGYAVRRHSESTGQSYFYSASKAGGYVVRTAVPYSLTLRELLRADFGFMRAWAVITLLMCVLGYFATRRVGQHVARLNDFAAKAERGERIAGTEPFPDDELGKISSHIVRLYARLQQAVADRETEHRQALREQRERDLMKRRLTNNINHELKTPLASIQLCLETLVEHPELPDSRRRELIGRCYAGCGRLRALLADVAVLTRLDDGAANISRERIALRRLVDEVCADFAAICSSRGMELSVSIADDIVVDGNRSLLESVFRNLIDNAVTYSGGSLVEISLEGSGAGGMVELAVADNGHGVDAEHLPRLFERFYRVDGGRSRDSGGTGLGLAIVKNAVAWHGGTIRAELRPEGGLRFVFTLPACL